MFEKVLYVCCFFGITLIIQFLLSKTKKITGFWHGTSTIIAICMLGLISNNINYLAGILGFVMADDVGKAIGWHK